MNTALVRGIGIACCCFLAQSARAQSSSASPLPRLVINRPIDDNQVTRVRGTTHPLIRNAADVGRVPARLPMDRVVLMLKGSAEQEGVLEQLLADQQDPTSAHYHQWLTPQQFGQQFGASQQDISLISGWLQSHGFRIDNVANGRRQIQFSGTARQVEDAFHTEIHHFVWNGETHTANATDISIPETLASVVAGVASLSNFFPKQVQPQLNFATGSHAMTPSDFATIYNVAPLWNEGFDGSGQTIAIVGRSNININDVVNFRTISGLPPNTPNIILNGADPGILSDGEGDEALLDTEWSGAIAPGATIDLVVTANTNAMPGILASALYIVDNAVSSIVSTSFLSCEAADSSATQLFWNNIWRQAAAQGMSVFVSAGDSGSAGCETDRNSVAATHGFGVNGIASTAYNVAVGGTQFEESGADSAYWNSVNSSNRSSAKVYIPEVVWNESSALGGRGLWSGGGGISQVWSTPSWQTGDGVPTVDPGTLSSHHRYLPDVSLSAAGHDGYVLRLTSTATSTVGGTSASTPAFAGIMAIVNQVSNQANGNPNPRLYALAAQHYQDVFHDITQGSNAVPCAAGSPNCINGMIGGYDAHPGYDLATGWGSVDAYNLANLWAVPTGTVAANPNPCVITSNSVCASTITWSTQNVSAASVRVSVNGGAETELAQSTLGSVSAPWILAGNQYKFVVYTLDTNSALSSVTVTAVRPTGTITASPDPCVITYGNSCATMITWNTQNVGAASVRVSVNGGAEIEVEHSVSGSVSVPWITAGSQYRFLLYGLDVGILLNSVAVTGTSGGTTAASGASLGLYGNTSWQENGAIVTIHVDQISNTGSGTSGRLRLQLWATVTPYSDEPVLTGYVLASLQFTYVLGPNQYFSNVTQTVPFKRPPAGRYYTTLTLEEYTGSEWVIRDYVTYSSPNTW